jgi:phosphatidylinositol kinase/protein kinase (PI-3  family)
VAPLDRLSGELKDKDDFVRMRAAKDLSQYVATQARELKNELFGEFMSDLNKHISQLVSSSNLNEVIGGIIAINELIDVDFRSHTIALARLADALKVGLNSSDPTVLSLAAQALGRLSRLPITLTSEICVVELKRALESLKEKQESRRHGAILVLRAMAAEAPTLFYGQMSTFVVVVWFAMRDSRQAVRMLAAETLGIALRLIGERDNAFQWNRYLFESTINGFTPNGLEPDVHGSLLALGELLTNAKDFMSGRTNEVCNLLQRYAREKEKAQSIKQTVISLLPKAAASNPDAFVASSLQTFMDYLLGIITSPASSKSNTASSSTSSTGTPTTAASPSSTMTSGSATLNPAGALYGSSTSYLLSHYGYANTLPFGTGIGAAGVFTPPALYGQSPFNATLGGTAVSSSSSSAAPGGSSVNPIASTQPIPFFYPSDHSDRSLALFAVGELALALGSRSDRFRKEDLDRVIKEIQETLTHHSLSVPVKQRTTAASANDALACLTMLAQAVGPAIHQGTGMRALLDQIFSVKLSPQLIAALTALVDHIPSLVKDIQLRLVEKLSGVLRQKFTPSTKSSAGSSSVSSGSNFGSLSAKDSKKLKTLISTNSTKSLPQPMSTQSTLTAGEPKGLGLEPAEASAIGITSSPTLIPSPTAAGPASPTSSGPSGASAPSTYLMVEEERTPELIALALNTLGSFNVIGYIQNIDEFLRDIAVNFLEEDNTTIRREAAVAVPQLLVRICSNPKFVSTPVSSFPLSEVIERLLLVGISDVDPAIRHTVLLHLDPTLDAFLAAPENLRCLLIALNDEVFTIRETAIAIIGRLSLRNPSDVMPSLRRTLIQLLTELEFGGDSRLKAESAQLLSVLIRNSRNLIEPYVKPILKALLPKLDPSQDPRVCQEILSAVGELAPAGQDMVASHMDTLIPLIVSYLADQATTGRRELALRVLAQLTRYTSHVVDPLSRWPDLLHLLLAIAKTEKSKFVRRQVLRVLGTMGALDPYTHKMTQPSQGASVMEADEDDDDKAHRQQLKHLAAARGVKPGVVPNPGQVIQGMRAIGATGTGMVDVNYDATNTALLLAPAMTTSTSRKAAFNDPNSDTYYPYIAIKALSNILWDPSLGAYHEKVVKSIVMITKECVGESKVHHFLPVIMPPFLHLLGGAEHAFSVLLLNQISLLVTIAKGMSNVREYLTHVFHMVSDLWHSELLSSVLQFIEKISSVMGDEFMVFLPFLIPKLLSVLDSDNVETCMRILRTLEWIGPSLDDYLHLVAPAIMTLVNQADSEPIRIAAMQTIGRLCRVLNFSEYASRIIQPMARLLQTQVLSMEFKNTMLSTLCHLVYQLGSEYAIFVPVMNRILNKRQITHATYEFLVSKVLKNQAILESELPPLGELVIVSTPAPVATTKSTKGKEKEKPKKDAKADEKRDTKAGDASASAAGAGGAQVGATGTAGGTVATPAGNAKSTSAAASSSDASRATTSAPAELKLNESNLRKAWAASSQSTRDDWDEWMRRFSVELVRESPQPALRYCLELAQEYFPLVKDVFTAAFVSCWEALQRQARTEFTDNLRTALKSPHMPREILQQWLNVAEFMEQSRIDPIEIHKELGRLAFKCHAYAKALHYKEQEFQKQQTPEAVEALITINTQLQQPEAAEGMLRYSQERMNLDLRESWYEKLHRWEDALLVHQSKRPKTIATAVSTRALTPTAGAGPASNNAPVPALTSAVTWPQPTIPTHDEPAIPNKTGSIGGTPGSPLVVGTGAATTGTSPGSKQAAVVTTTEPTPAPKDAAQIAPAPSGSAGMSASSIQNAIQQQQKQQEIYNLSIVGEMRCLHSLGEWDRLLELSVENWKPEHKNRTAIAPWAASAAWHLHDWNSMATFLEELKDTTVESLMMKTVLQLQKAATTAEFEQVRFLIDKTRDAVDVEITPLLAESYQRAYDALINVQLLAEMEEVIDFKMYPERRSVIRRVWRERLDRCQRSVPTWQRILAIRAIAEMEESTWLKFAMLCRKSGALRQSHKVLTILMGTDPAKQPMAPLPTQRPSVTYQYILQLWTAGAREIAYQHLLKFEQRLEEHRPLGSHLDDLGSSLAALGLTGWGGSASTTSSTSTPVNVGPGSVTANTVQGKFAVGDKRRTSPAESHLLLRPAAASPFALMTSKLEQNGKSKVTSHAKGSAEAAAAFAQGNNYRASKMQARCALTLGLWQLDMHEHSLDSEKIDLIIRNLGKALVCDPTWHKAWHVWASTNFDMATIYEKRMARHAQRRKHAPPQPIPATAAAMQLRSMGSSYVVAGQRHQSSAGAHTNNASPKLHVKQSSSGAVINPSGSTSATVANPSSNAPGNAASGTAQGPTTGTTTSELKGTTNATTPLAGRKHSATMTVHSLSTGAISAATAPGGPTGQPGGPAPLTKDSSSHTLLKQQQNAQQHNNSMTLDKERLFRHVEAAVKGFFRSIALSHGAQTLQDTLRLLTLWFKYGGDRLIEPVLQEGFNSVPIDTWLPVIPQIIARMDSNNINVRRMVSELLSRIGKEHPQALVYPLVLTAKSTNTTRQSMAHTMMNQMRQYDQLHYHHTDYTGGTSRPGQDAFVGGKRRHFAHEDDEDDIGWAFSPNGGHDQILGAVDPKSMAHRKNLRPTHIYSTFAAGEEGMFTHHSTQMNDGAMRGSNSAAGAAWNAEKPGSGQGQANFLSLIDQALLISEELIRVAISDTEAWHECLEEASRAYFVDHNPQQMVSIVRPLHEALLQPTQHATSALNENGVVGGRLHTSMELSFRQAYSAPLNQAWGWCLKYLETGSTMCLNQAWDLYWYVYHAINKQQEKLTTLQLSAVSPRLLGLTQLSLAVPGTYQVGTPLVTISGFHPVVSVIPSKQRPRKLRMTGSDGVPYSFLLKGHEDLRQDERVMQLFGLINNLLLANPQTANKHLRIQRFAVIPLSPNSGLIGWVPHCDTINLLIKEYRQTADPKIPVDSENQILEKQYPEYPQLMVIQKIEVFKQMMARFDGKDLANIMWLKSPSSEVWLDRRTNYIRSLAVMSMAGYILGLGDRHPSNIMIDRYSGHVVHIDFGDCFETAMLREKHPEKVPFRLTRMVINAMEVSGIEGTFRTTCNQVLEVMRENRDSLMAVLEAFVHDPLINWGLKNKGTTKDSREGTKDGTATAKEGEGGNGETTHPTMAGHHYSGASLHETISSSGAFSAASHRFRDYNFQDDESGDGYNFRHPASVSHGATPSNAERHLKEVSGEKELNERALSVISRVHNKLTGRDFGDRRNQGRAPLTVAEQVHKLILQATSTENLCQSFAGWCPWW